MITSMIGQYAKHYQAEISSEVSPGCKAANSLGHHHLDKLLVVDLTITVNISLSDHFIHFFISELLAEICHHMTQLCCTDEAITITIEHLEGLDEFLFRVCVLHLPCHQ